MAFHWRGGWFFERVDKGAVHIYHQFYREAKQGTIEGVGVDIDLEIDHDSWCSIIAFVSLNGESAKKWEEAIKFHNYLQQSTTPTAKASGLAPGK